MNAVAQAVSTHVLSNNQDKVQQAEPWCLMAAQPSLRMDH